jgi:hypothetical protein
MNTKALITTLAILGSASSLAVASPSTPSTQFSASASWSYRTPVRTYPAPAHAARGWSYTPVRTVVRDRRDNDWTRSNGWGYQPRGTLLADSLSYNAGEYRKDILLQGRRFDTVTLNAEGGNTFIEVVKIEFLDGGPVQTIPVNRALCNDESMTFDVDGNHRPINRIFVYRHDGPDRSTQFRSQGEFSVIGM